MTRKEIKKEKNATTALLVCTIFAILINIVAVVLNLRALIIAFPDFAALNLLFVLLCLACIVGLSTFIPDNLRTIKKCNGLLEDPHQ